MTADSTPASNWVLALEGRRRFAQASIVILALATLYVSALRNPIDYDEFWHLRMGMDWVENGLSPWQDHYSFTFRGHQITNPPVAFQAVLYLAVEYFGERAGTVLLKLACFLLALGLMMAWLRQIRAPVIAWLIVLPLLVVLIQYRAQVRPELVSYSLSIVAMMLYYRAANRLSIGGVAPIALLLLAWTNYHSSIVGYVIFCGLFIDIAVRNLRERAGWHEWLRWAGWGLVLVAVGFANPAVAHPALEMLRFPAEWKVLIQEYGSPSLYLGTLSFYLCAGVSVGTVALCIVQRKFGYLVIAAILLYAASTMARMVTPAGIVVLCLIAHALRDAQLEARAATGQRRWTQLAPALGFTVSILAVLSGVAMARAFMQENRVNTALFPSQLVDYMIDRGMQGRIFNEYPLGGYLIYRMAPDSEVFIDGRTHILYPVSHYRQLLANLASPDELKKTLERDKVGYVILESTPERALLAQSAGLELDFVDARYALYLPDGGNFPLAGRLWARPYCWAPQLAAPLTAEWQQALFLLPPAAPVNGLINQALEYAAASDPVAFLAQPETTADWTDAGFRFAAYRAIELGESALALEYLAAVGQREAKDYLAAALANLRAGDAAEAERAIDAALRQRWPYIEPLDLALQLALLEEIRAVRPLELFDDAYLETLANQVPDALRPKPGIPLTTWDFCPDSHR